MKKVFTVALLCLLASSVSAAPKKRKDPPLSGLAGPRHWYCDPKWWAGTALIWLAVAGDMGSTAHANRPDASNPLLGDHPTNRRLVLVGLGAAATYTTLHALAWRESHNDPSPFWRNLGRWGLPAIAVGSHGSAAVRNYRGHLTRPAFVCPSGTVCR